MTPMTRRAGRLLPVALLAFAALGPLERSSLATPPDGSFHLLWVDTRDGQGEVQTAKIELRE